MTACAVFLEGWNRSSFLGMAVVRRRNSQRKAECILIEWTRSNVLVLYRLPSVRMRCNTRRKEVSVLRTMPGDAYSCREATKGFMAFSTGFHAYTPRLFIFGIQKIQYSSELSVFTKGCLNFKLVNYP